MYENITFNVIMQRMLAEVPDTVDKREGSVIWDALAPAALELQLAYIEMDVILNESFADTQSRTFLIKRAAERGITPTAATYAIAKGQFNIDVPIGSRYSLDELNYVVTEKISAGIFKLRCETSGTDANSYLGTLIPIDYINGLQTAALTEVLIPGEDEEATEAFRTRYLNSFDRIAFGGNRADYIEKVEKIQGVGGVKPYRAWQGGGTVKLVIINSEWQKPTTEMINTVQTLIDPTVNAGDGVGIAPIDHVVTVFGVTNQTVNIQTTITYQSGWNFTECKPYIEAAIDAYFKELSQVWDETNNLIVRVSQIETRLLNVAGILDIQDTKLNGVQANYVVPADSIPVRGTIVA
ncbi:baseplate J/gp47 family protein [Anaerospora hongkongensis]|uniref:baseplate J/gp47 family protein n=1 Tax=Anaerospora hongkongensis TaxID=244830 RepID=UPI0028A1252E|nr:baseplate J/gp47 family protein [Anaerospora hongkongensis]